MRIYDLRFTIYDLTAEDARFCQIAVSIINHQS
jgi:hypothetical protein